jgi:two-component system NtrC family response regulator
MANVLIIDDDPLICQTISNLVRQMGHQATSSCSLEEGVKLSSSEWTDIVFLDVRLPDGNGLEALPRIQGSPSLPEVIIMTGYGDPDGAELAMKHGVWDYIQKPSSVDAMVLSFIRALQYRAEKDGRKVGRSLDRKGIVGNSPPMLACLNLLAQVAGSDANVVITGETGTGKELFAVAIHENSFRAGKSFVVVDCAALPENLVESILFGHEKGAYTGADRAQEGLILQANGGTLFLDEVGELPLAIQKSFLRVLQEKKFRPVGAKQEVASDFRVIAASNRDLDELVRQGKFREDLLFRLRTFTIDLPPLRERPEDIKDLVTSTLDEICKRNGIEDKEFSPEFISTLQTYSWPGNVRELMNALERAAINARYERTLFPKHLPFHIRAQIARSAITDKETVEPQVPAPFSPLFPKIQELRGKAIAEAEERYLRDLISHTQGNIKEATQISGLSRSRLYSLLKKHHIST